MNRIGMMLEQRRLRRGLIGVAAAGVFGGFLAFYGRPVDAEPGDVVSPAADTQVQGIENANTAEPVQARTAEPGAEPTTEQVAATSTPTRIPDPVSPPDSTRRRYPAGEDPEFATRMGWPVAGPELRAGAILPHRRIVAYYGNPLSKRMGVLGEYEPEDMLRRLDREVAAWNEADPATPVVPALHLVAVVAQGDPGPSGKYRTRMRDSLVERVAEWAATRDGLVFLDVQVGTGTLQDELPRLMEFMARENFHLGIDPEFSMKDGTPPGKRIGRLDAEDINYAIDLLARVVDEHNLPPKVLVVHRFTRGMVTNADRIRLDPRVQVVMHMDGWGAPWLKRDTYKDYIVREPVQFTGFKLFYHNDTKKGDPLMTPADILRLRPIPLYIQYQ